MPLTCSLCLPGRSFGVLKGDRQGENRPLSSLHWNVAPASLEVNLNFGRFLRVFFGPLVIVVSGGVWGVWIENERVATEEFVAASLPRTRKV